VSLTGSWKKRELRVALTREQLIAGLQKIADEGKEANLTESGRAMFDAAIREGAITVRGRGMGSDLPVVGGVIGRAQEMVSPRFQEDLPEVEFSVGMPTNPAEAQRFIENLETSPVQLPEFQKYRGAKIVEGRYGRPVVETIEGERRYLNKPGFNLADIPRAVSGTMGFVEEAAPYLSGGGAVQGAARQVIGQGVTGALVESGKAGERFMRGEEQRPMSLLTTPAIAMAGDVLGRGLFSIGAKIYNRVTGRGSVSQNIFDESGQIKPEAARDMRANATSQDIDNAAFAALMDEAEAGNLSPDQLARLDANMESFITSGQATAAQAERYNLFKSYGLEPTRAQVTRTADDFMAQQEAAKTSGAVRSSLEQQQVQLGRAFEEQQAATGGAVSAEVAPIQQAVIDKGLKLDNQINALYRQAEEQLSGAPSVDISGYLNRLYKFRSENKLSNGVYKALRGQITDDLGISIPKGKAAPDGPVLVTGQQAEQIRKYGNRLYGTGNPTGKNIVTETKKALTDDVTNALGADSYATARKAYQDFQRGLDPDQLSKFSRNQKSLIRDLLDETIPSERVFERVVASKGYTAKDLRALKNYIVGRGKNIDSKGVKAWSDLRAETLDYIRQNAFGGAIGELGGQTLTRARLQSVISRIGMDKLKVIFNPEEIKFLNDIVNISKIIEPVSGTFQGAGPSAQAISQLQKTTRAAGNKISGRMVEIAESLLKVLSQSADERRALSGAAPILTEARRRATRIRPEITATGGRIGAAGLEQSLGEE